MSSMNGTSNGQSRVTRRNPANGTMTSHQHGTPQEGATVAPSALSRITNFTLVPILLMVICPNVCLLLWYASAHHDGSFLAVYHSIKQQGLLAGLTGIWRGIPFLSPFSCLVIMGYCLFALVLMTLLPGPIVHGPVTTKGNVPVYRDNGFMCFLVTMTSFAVLQYGLLNYGLSATLVYDRFGEILITLTVLSHVLCVVLYLKGSYAPSTSDHGVSGNPVFDYYWGTELYPKVCGVDIKVFTNCRFGMTIWPLLVTIHALKSYELHGFVDSIWVSCFLQMAYFVKFFWWESGYMRTIDIMVDRAGFYICWGCLTYIPGTYASVSMYLVNHPVRLGPYFSGFLLVVGTSAIWINYWADLQKLQVRNTNGNCMVWGRAPEVIRAQYTLESGEKRESILLVSGFWGLARHFHYVPELTLALCWTLPALFTHLAPYVYLITLTGILVHRTYRDDDKCSSKYGSHWTEYRRRVPYKIVPGVF